MNGRIYSPSLGRMLSPDPVTQAPENGQNYNRYTYALNNPLKYADPSGYTLWIPGQGGYVIGDSANAEFDNIWNGIYAVAKYKARFLYMKERTRVRAYELCQKYGGTCESEYFTTGTWTPDSNQTEVGDGLDDKGGARNPNPVVDANQRMARVLMAEKWFSRAWDGAWRHNRAMIESGKNNGMPVGLVIRGGFGEPYRLGKPSTNVPQGMELYRVPGLVNNNFPVPGAIENATAVTIMTPGNWDDPYGDGYDWNQMSVDTGSPIFVTVSSTNDTYVFTGEGDPTLWEQ